MKSMIKGGYISIEDAKIFARKISIITPGWTGSDLAGLLRNAASYSINRYYDTNYKEDIHIQWNDINSAYHEMNKINKFKIIVEKIKYQLFNKNDYIRKLEDIINE